MGKTDLYEHWRTFHKGLDAPGMQISFANHLEYSLSKDQYTATARDLYKALALAVRDRLVERWIRTQQMYYNLDVKRVCYLSAEYLMGRVLLHNLINLGNLGETTRALEDLNLKLEDLAEEEPDAGLGNGGLGRLAAAFMESLATTEIPAIGYGIRYEFGMFEQVIRNGAQVEQPDEWLKFGNPWEIQRPERSYQVCFYGRTRREPQGGGGERVVWTDAEEVTGVAYDTPVDGYGNDTVNTLRLWSARASKEFDLAYFQHGDYLKAVEDKNRSENISKVLYPNDNIFQGQELRLKQQYFFVSCSIQDIIRRYLVNHDTFREFPDRVAIQLNDTHPSLAIVELMRILVDDFALPWDFAWDVTRRSISYTNHTLLSEALERWPVSMLGRLLPRHLELIYEINHRFLAGVAVASPNDPALAAGVSLIEEGPEKKVRMAHLAIVGSHAVNGVSRLHSGIMSGSVFRDFHRLFPERFTNKTNGITPRRWLLVANPGLSALVTSRIGDSWTTDLTRLRDLEEHAGDPAFLEEFRRVKAANKERLADLALRLTGVTVDPASIFDVQVKRIHEYKRQLLNILHVIHLWLGLKEEPGNVPHPRTFLFGGTAAPAYREAKAIICLINRVAALVNDDPATRDLLKVVFLPDYRVTLAERVIPAADVSEQISTAGFEASGTGNMKMALNGAVTVGTLDGSNIEIREEVGEENFFAFGLTVPEMADFRAGYNPRDAVGRSPLLSRVLDLVREGFFCPDDPDAFRSLVDSLLTRDNYLVLADFEAYRLCHRDVEAAYRDRERWLRMSLLNVARSGRFSSDRAVLEYNEEIWRTRPVPITRECDRLIEGGVP